MFGGAVGSTPGKGFSGGGISTAQTTAIESLRFSDEVQQNLSATLAIARSTMASFQSRAHGLWLGSDFSAFTEIDGISFSSEAAYNPTTALAAQQAYCTGITGNLITGYVSGHFTDGIKRVTAYNAVSDSSYVTAITLQFSLEYSTSAGNTTHGYFFAGLNNIDGIAIDDIDGMVYATETQNNPAALLSVNASGRPAVGFQSAAYILSRAVSPAPAIEKFLYATESASVLGVALTHGHYAGADFQSFLKGYAVGGFSNVDSVKTATIDGILFATETVFNANESLSAAVQYNGGCQSGGAL